MPFQIHALPERQFEHLFLLNDEELAQRQAIRKIANKKPGFPCRVSLEDASVGEEVILAHFEHHAAASPFRASHAVYIRKGATEAHVDPDQVPQQLRTRTLSLRAFDAAGMMTFSDLVEGTGLEPALNGIFADSAVTYIHIHYAKPGCFAASVTRE